MANQVVDVSDEEVDGEAASEDEATPKISYDVTSCGSDPEVEVLVSRLRRGDILIPPFQRDYVWRQPEASKFVESLLLGLPGTGRILCDRSKFKQTACYRRRTTAKDLAGFLRRLFQSKTRRCKSARVCIDEGTEDF
jgi:hypothetical protein